MSIPSIARTIISTTLSNVVQQRIGERVSRKHGFKCLPGDDALPFAKQIRQYALIGDRNLAGAVGDVETDFQIVAVDYAALEDTDHAIERGRGR